MTISQSNVDRLSLSFLALPREFSVELISLCRNLHNQSDLSGISTPVLWLSVSLWTVTLPCSHSHCEALFSSLVSFSSPSHNSTVKSVFTMLAARPQRGFCAKDSPRNHSDFMHLAWFVCLGCVYQEKQRVICIFCCEESPEACEKGAFAVLVEPVCEAHGMQMIFLVWQEHHVWAKLAFS